MLLPTRIENNLTCSYGNFKRIGITLTISVSAFENSNCQSLINLLLRAGISYRGCPFCLEAYRVSNFVNP